MQPTKLLTMKPECLQCGQRVGWIGVGVNMALVALKVMVGISAGSKACLADALHSSANIVTALAIFLTRKLRDRPADDAHPYGYGKIEFIAAGMVRVLRPTSSGSESDPSTSHPVLDLFWVLLECTANLEINNLTTPSHKHMLLHIK